ncbi:expressed unknown protein [Seminavis robusta]|uniref:Uncharacterized protein n=1 Tax=Seminavis robusta TaxID=568900 RepID=A0A9N8ENF2_9STRA|nr:expressed unknown protein [Seminavis robusta]|eukprot:Sro1278_g258800.1 n/a (452) ;mRNA; r:20644-22079
MGQCSTLPEARNSSAARHDGSGQVHRDNSSRQRLKEDGRTESLDFNKLTTLSNENMKNTDQRKLHVSVPANGEHEFAKFPQMDTNQPQARDPDGQTDGMVEPMDVDQRDVSQPIVLPPPPENAVRARCYKLNLDSEMAGLTGNKSPHVCLGPFAEPPPPLTYSSSDDSAVSASGTNVAIQTAQIFRGITISKDGTILSQNARATRSNRGNKTKRGEKSRQAAKIDKAKDLVEEAVMTGKDAESNEPANMVSLVIIGAYDDMKHLVRDGSKKLREAEGMPDDTLLAVNRPRSGHSQGMVSPKQRVPPSSSQRNSAAQDLRSRNGLPQSAPPKLKSNPRDRPKVRRGDEKPRRSGFVTDSCNDMMDTNPQGTNGDGDWRDALGFSRGFHSIWNCGGTEEAGAVSPTQVCSPKDGTKPQEGVNPHHQHPQQPVYEGRDSALGHLREGEVSARAN